MQRSKLLSLVAMAAGFAGGIVFVAACPIPADELPWLDSDSDATSGFDDDDDRPGGLRISEAHADPGDGGRTRVLIASEDSSRSVGGHGAWGATVMLAEGPVFLTDAMMFPGINPQFFISHNAGCASGVDVLELDLEDLPAISGLRVFVPAGDFLCKQGGEVHWSGFVPYDG